MRLRLGSSAILLNPTDVLLPCRAIFQCPLLATTVDAGQPIIVKCFTMAYYCPLDWGLFPVGDWLWGISGLLFF